MRLGNVHPNFFLCLLAVSLAAALAAPGSLQTLWAEAESDDRLSDGAEKTRPEREDMEVEDLQDPELVSDAIVERLLEATAGGDSRNRREALWAISAYRNERLSQRVLAILDGSFEVPERDAVFPVAALAAGRMKLGDATPPLLKLLGSESAWGRETAIWALGEIRAQEAQDALQLLLGNGKSEWERWLASEALNKILKSNSFKGPAFQPRPLNNARVLYVGVGPEHAYSYSQPVRDAKVPPPEELAPYQVAYEGVFANHLNPAMGFWGGINSAQGQKFLESLAFDNEKPQFDLVLLNYLIPQDAPDPFLKWRLWNYVRRGGRLLIHGENLFQAAAILDPRRGTVAVKCSWETGLFDALLPSHVGRKSLPFQLGEDRLGNFWVGSKDTGAGRTLILARPFEYNRDEESLQSLFRKTYRGEFNRDQPAIIASGPEWLAIYHWMLGGPEALVGRIAVRQFPRELRAGTNLLLEGVFTRYVEHGDFHIELTLARSEDNGEVCFRSDLKMSETEFRWDIPLSAALPDGSYLLSLKLSNSTINEPVQVIRRLLPVKAKLGIQLSAPALLPTAGEKFEVEAEVRNRWGDPLGECSLVFSLEDVSRRKLVRKSLTIGGANAGGSFFGKVEFNSEAYPAGRYFVAAEVWSQDQLFARVHSTLDRLNRFDFTQEIIWTLFTPNGPWTSEQIRNYRKVGINCMGGASSFGLYSGSIHSPAFVPQGLWPRESYEGSIGEEWRKHGRKTASDPLFTMTDTIEEADLEVSSRVHQEGYADKVQEGYEQYRIYLKSRYRTLSALNQAWKVNYASWNQVYLMGPVWDGRAVSFTARMGGGGGEMVPVPQAPDPAQGIHSLVPFTDQNAFRWSYLSLIHRIRYDAYHSADARHPLTPGGASGLFDCWDNHHWRHYLGWIYNPAYAATLARPNYGLRPFCCLIGSKSTYTQMSWLNWSALLGGARMIMTYGDGSLLGDFLLDENSQPSPAGEVLAKVIERIRPRQQVLLDARNVVESGVLLFGTNLYADSPPAWLFEAVALNRILPDFGAGFSGRKIVFAATNAPADALIAFAEAGGTVVTLPTTSRDLTDRLGLEREPAGAAPEGPGTAMKAKMLLGEGKDELLSTSREQVRLPDAEVACVYEDGVPAALISKRGKGRHVHLNLVPAAVSMATAASLIRKLVEGADVPIPLEILDAKGSAHLRVAGFELESFDASQRYLCICPDLPADPAQKNKPTEGRVVFPNTRGIVSVYDVFNGKNVPIESGNAGSSFNFSLPPGEGTLYGLVSESLEQPLVTLSLESVLKGRPLLAEVALPAEGGRLARARHSVRLSLRDGQGIPIAGLQASASVNGHGVLRLFPAENDPPGPWTLELLDLTSGRTCIRKVPVGLPKGEPLLCASAQSGRLLLGGEGRWIIRLANLGEAPLPPSQLRLSSAEQGLDVAAWRGELKEALQPEGTVLFEAAVKADREAPPGESLLTLIAEEAAGKSHRCAFTVSVPQAVECTLADLPEMDADVTYFAPEASIRSNLASSLSGEVEISLQSDQLLHLPRTQKFRIEPGGSFQARWEVRLTRLGALSLRRAEASRLSDEPVPGELLYGIQPAPRPLTIQWKATSDSGERLAGEARLHVALNRFEPRPPRLLPGHPANVQATVRNELQRMVNGTLRLEGRETWESQTQAAEFQAVPHAVSRVAFPVQLRPNAARDPGLYSANLSVLEDGLPRASSTITVEESEAQRWWIHGPVAGVLVDAMDQPPQVPDAKEAAAAGWGESASDWFVPLPGHSRNPAPGVYFASAVFQAGENGSAQVKLLRLIMPSSSRSTTAKVFPNQWVELMNFRAWINGEPAGGVRPAPAEDEVDLREFAEEALIKKGDNRLVIAFDRDSEMEGVLVQMHR